MTHDNLARKGLRVKPLVWDDNGSADVYRVTFSNGQGPKAFLVSRGSKIIGWYDDPSEAKAAAQADYEAHILVALEPAPAQDVAGLIERLERWGDSEALANHFIGQRSAQQDCAEAAAALRRHFALALPEGKALVEALVTAGDWLAVCAQTTGGTAGRDDALVAAIDSWKAALAALEGRT
jgi:hypothetical protein